MHIQYILHTGAFINVLYIHMYIHKSVIYKYNKKVHSLYIARTLTRDHKEVHRLNIYFEAKAR